MRSIDDPSLLSLAIDNTLSAGRAGLPDHLLSTYDIALLHGAADDTILAQGPSVAALSNHCLFTDFGWGSPSNPFDIVVAWHLNSTAHISLYHGGSCIRHDKSFASLGVADTWERTTDHLRNLVTQFKLDENSSIELRVDFSLYLSPRKLVESDKPPVTINATHCTWAPGTTEHGKPMKGFAVCSHVASTKPCGQILSMRNLAKRIIKKSHEHPSGLAALFAILATNNVNVTSIPPCRQYASND